MKKISKMYLFILLFLLIPASYIVIDAEEEIDWSIFSSEYNEESFEGFLKEQSLLIFDDEPSLTFITPGVGCDASSWGYDDENLNYIFECLNNRNAQIFKLYELPGKIKFSNLSDDENHLSTIIDDYTKPLVFVCDLKNNTSTHKIEDYSNINSAAYNELEKLINYTIFEYVKMKISLGVNEDDLKNHVLI